MMSENCPNCGAPDNLQAIDPVRGDVVCTECGCCLPDRVLDETLEKRNFADSDKDHNRGQELDKYLSFASSGTVIGKGNSSLQRAANRLKPAAMSTQERNLNDGFHNLHHYENMFHLKRAVVNTSKDLMAEFEKKKGKTVHGARSDAFAVAIVWFAMNLHSEGRKLAELCAESNIPEKSVRSYTKKIQKIIPHKLKKHTRAEDFVPMIVSTVDGPLTLERLAGDIVRRAINHVCSAKCRAVQIPNVPATIAAGAVALALDLLKVHTVSVEDVATCATVSAATALAMAKQIQVHWDAMYSDELTHDHSRIVAEIVADAKAAGVGQ